VLLRVTPEVLSAQWAWGDASRLSVSLADRFLLEVPYETPDFVGSPVGILPYCDEEDIDFGMRVDEILNNPTKRENVWSPEWWEGGVMGCSGMVESHGELPSRMKPAPTARLPP
jgi:hypothetical protein